MGACLINTLASIRVYAFLIINAVVCLVDRLLLVCLRVFALVVVELHVLVHQRFRA